MAWPRRPADAALGPAAGMPRTLPMTGQPSPTMPVTSLSRRDSAVIYITAPLRTGNSAVTSPPRSDLFGLPRPGARTILSRRPGYRSLPLQTDSTRDIARYTNRLRDGVA